MDYALLVVVLLLLPVVIARPYVGAVLYTALAYLKPQNLVGGHAMDWRLSLFVLAAMALGLAIAMFQGRERPMLGIPFFGLLALLLGAMFVATRTAIYPDIAVTAWLAYLQLFAGVAFTVMLCNTPDRLRGILITAALALGAMATISCLHPEWDDGRLMGAGGEFRDSNDFALALTMVLPLLVFLRRSAKERWQRIALTVPIPFVLAAIVLTYSRGGFLALAAVAAGWVLLSRGRMVKLGLVPVGIALFMGLAPAKYFDRISTIDNYQHDASARDRLSSWNVATRIASERPLTGVGPGNFLVVYDRYKTDFRLPHVAHNTWLQVAADSGLGAAAIFTLLLLAAMTGAWRIGRRTARFRQRLAKDAAAGDPNARARIKRIAWIEDHGNALVLALVGFAVGAQFLSRDNLDLFYLLAGLAGALAAVARRELAAEGWTQPKAAAVPALEARLAAAS